MQKVIAWDEMVKATNEGLIAACVPVEVDGESYIFITASNPIRNSNILELEAWINDQTDYSGQKYGANFFGHDGIGLAYAVAMIRFTHSTANQYGMSFKA